MTLFKENWGLFQVELLASQGLLSVSPSLIVQFQRLLFPTVSVSVGILGNVDANTGLDVQEMFGGKCGEGYRDQGGESLRPSVGLTPMLRAEEGRLGSEKPQTTQFWQILTDQ